MTFYVKKTRNKGVFMKKLLIIVSFAASLITTVNSLSHLKDYSIHIEKSKLSYSIVNEKSNVNIKKALNNYNAEDYEEFNVYDAFETEFNALQELLATFEVGTEEYENTIKLCNITNECLTHCSPEQITSLYEIANNARYSVPVSNRSIEDPIVLGALAYFAYHKYDLSYELLAHAFDDYVEEDPYFYTPVHGYRVFQSELTFLIANDSYSTELEFILNHPELENTFIFEDEESHEKYLAYPITDNPYETDLRYAIQAFSFDKINKTVTIRDRYDFASHEIDGLEGYVINYLYNLQDQHILKEYDLRITYDYSYFLRLKTIENNDGVWTIEVKNPNPSPVDFIYNKKMCNLDDAKNWTNLTDVSYKTVAGNSSTTVSITTYGFATSVSFSFFNGATKYMIYGDGLYSNGMIDYRFFQKTQTYNSRIRLMGKDGNKWLIKLKNATSYKALVEYNTKMCFYSDAQNWTGLLDLTDIYLQPGEMRYIYISENGLATSIAVTFSGENTNCSYYADNLSMSGTMSLSFSSRSSRIRIENRGKSGTKWNIRVKNPTNHNITVYSNCKMCFENDAKNWTSIGSNERSVVITPSQQYADIQISENWFATHITICYISGSTRYITYANELNENKSIHMYWNTKSV